VENTVDVSTLKGVPYTLMIPLVARARAREYFPNDYIADPTAETILKKIGKTGDEFMNEMTVRAVRDRTQIFRDCAADFFKRNPKSTGASIGCGLSNYFQWLNNGTNKFVDADLPEVMEVRRQLLTPINDRHRFLDLSLTSPNWWDELSLPNEPVVIIIEGVLMYLKPEEVAKVLHTFGERAAPGSELLFDHMCWLAVGQAQKHSAVMKHTNAEFAWGIRKIEELTAPHTRLRLLPQKRRMSGNFLRVNFERVFQTVTSVPFYGIARVGVT